MVCWVHWASSASRAFQPGELHRTREGHRDGHAGGHFQHSCCTHSWHQVTHSSESPSRLPLPVRVAVAGGPICAEGKPHIHQLEFLFFNPFCLFFPIQEGVSHVYYLLQLFLPYKSNKKRSTVLFPPVCFHNVEVIVAVVFLALSDWQHREQLPDR